MTSILRVNVEAFLEDSLICREHYVQVKAAAEYVRSVIGHRQQIDVAIVLGSGLNQFVNMIDKRFEIQFSEVPCMPVPTVASHQGRVIFGSMGPLFVAGIAGRIHSYEGRPAMDTAFNSMLFALLGCTCMVFTNSAGGAVHGMSEGSLCLMTDHIRFARRDFVGELFSSSNSCGRYYDEALQSCFQQACELQAIQLFTGTCAFMPGPTYETDSEVRAGMSYGAATFGMSTVPEVILSHFLGMKTIAVTFISNLAAGIVPGQVLTHGDVEKAAKERSDNFIRAFAKFMDVLVDRMPSFKSENEATIDVREPFIEHEVPRYCENGEEIVTISVYPCSADAERLSKPFAVTSFVNWSNLFIAEQAPHPVFDAHDLSSTVFVFPRGSAPSSAELKLAEKTGAYWYTYHLSATSHSHTYLAYPAHVFPKLPAGDSVASIIRNNTPRFHISRPSFSEDLPPLENFPQGLLECKDLLIMYGLHPSDAVDVFSNSVIWNLEVVDAFRIHDASLFHGYGANGPILVVFVHAPVHSSRFQLRGLLRRMKIDGVLRRTFLLSPSDALDANLAVGDTVMLRDHTNFSGWSPLTGANNAAWGPRFPDQHGTYMIPVKCAKYPAVVAALVDHSLKSLSPADRRLYASLGGVVGLEYVIAEAIVSRQLGLHVQAASWVCSAVDSSMNIRSVDAVVPCFRQSAMADPLFFKSFLQCENE
eukprot:ANDGO_08439.mRNA.1 Purine nucleoside phosphorylase 1